MPTSLLALSTTLNEGGAQRFTSTLLQHLDRSVVRPSLCLLRDDIGYPLPDDVPLHILDYRRYWHLPGTVRRLRDLIEDHKPDVLLSNVNATNLLAGAALRACRHQPAWVARIGSNPKHHDGPVRKTIARRTYPNVDRFVVNSAGLADELVGTYPCSEGRIEVILNPTDFELIDAAAAEPPAASREGKNPLLIAVGGLHPAKRYDVMIEAFARASRTRPANLWICGEGPERGPLQSLITKLNLRHSVKLMGFCKNPYAILRQGTLFVMSSAHEGLPNALIEAQGLGLAAVSTRCPHGPEEIIEDGKTGILVPVGDVDALAGAIRKLLDDPERLRRMSAEARASARRRFAVAPLTKQWEDLLVREARRRQGHGKESLP